MSDPLPPGVVRVFWRRTHAAAEPDIAGALTVLAADERARAARFRFARDRRDYTLAHALLRTTLADCGGGPPEALVFATGAHGKPRMIAPRSELSFNLTHTDGLVACAIAQRMHVGVDVEPVDRAVRALDIAERFFGPSEVRQIRELDGATRTTRFFELWTLKEAYIKAVGTGVRDLHAVAFDLNERGVVSLTAPEGAARTWHFGLYAPTPGWRLAVCASASAGRPRIDVVEAGGNTSPLAPLGTSVG